MRTNPMWAEHAKEHEKLCAEKFAKETADAIRYSSFYSRAFFNTDMKDKYATQVEVLGEKTLERVVKEPGTQWTVLNFASYKNPGGGYLEGAMSQEEYLCHETNLYSVLSSHWSKIEFYVPNRSLLNGGLYGDRAIYTPDIVHTGSGNKLNVITCAAPNASAGIRYGRFTREMANEALTVRIELVLAIAEEQGAENLVLGAFGCGVFGNEALVCAGLFKAYLTCHFLGVFKRVVFAVPPGANLTDFLRVFGMVES